MRSRDRNADWSFCGGSQLATHGVRYYLDVVTGLLKMKRSHSNVESVASTSRSKKAKRTSVREEEEDEEEESGSEMDISMLEEFIPVPSQLQTQDDQKNSVDVVSVSPGPCHMCSIINLFSQCVEGSRGRNN